jgi:hypothetical protein
VHSQISCNASNNGYSGSTSSSTGTAAGPTNYHATGVAAAINTSAATTGFASVLQPLEFNAPLLVFFRKVCYPQYVLNCAAGRDTVAATLTSSGDQPNNGHVTLGSGSGNGAVSRIFASQTAFQQWEGAVELHAACLDRVGPVLLH